MPNPRSFSVAPTQPVLIVPTSEPRPMFVYVDGKRTDTRRMNNQQQSLYSFDALLMVNGEREEGRVTSATASLPEIQFGGYLVGAGRTTITYRATADAVNNFTGRPFAYLSISVEVEQVVPAS